MDYFQILCKNLEVKTAAKIEIFDHICMFASSFSQFLFLLWLSFKTELYLASSWLRQRAIATSLRLLSTSLTICKRKVAAVLQRLTSRSRLFTVKMDRSTSIRRRTSSTRALQWLIGRHWLWSGLVLLETCNWTRSCLWCLLKENSCSS